MDGLASGAASDRDRLGRFQDGNSEWSARQRRVADLLKALNADYAATPSQQSILLIVARCLDAAATSRSTAKRTTSANTAQRLLRLLQRKEAPLRTVAELTAKAGVE